MGRSAQKKEAAVPTASHKVIPICCGAFPRTPAAFAALKARVVEALPRGTTVLRDCVVFATHDLAHDRPLATLDLVSCQSAFPQLPTEHRTRRYSLLLHFALNENGGLLLSPGEGLPASADLFQTVAGGFASTVGRRVP